VMEELNRAIFMGINGFANQSPFLDQLMISLSEFSPYLFILALIYLWFSKKTGGKDCSLYAGYSVLLGLCLNHIISFLYFHPRPFMDNLGTQLVKHAAESSFPSDHTTFMLAIAFSLLLHLPHKRFGCAAILLAVIGGVARVFCGVHYPFDLLASLVVATVSALTIYRGRLALGRINLWIIKQIDRLIK